MNTPGAPPGLTACGSAPNMHAMPPPFETLPAGSPLPLGATVGRDGIQFAIVSEHATAMRLDLFDAHDSAAPSRSIGLTSASHRTGNVWHVFVPGLSDGQLYGWRAEGPFLPSQGLRFNPNKLLMDPYARAFAGFIHAGHDAVFGFERDAPDTDLSFSTLDSAPHCVKSVALADNMMPDVGVLPRTPLSQTLIYELHVHGYTNDPSSGVSRPGSYLGLIEKIPHLQRLGVTAVELLPVFDFDADGQVGVDPVTGAVLRNYWGYSPVGFFAPESRFAADPAHPLAGAHAVAEFREMVRVFHDAGIEVILDVVYNHTGEGSELGPTWSFRGLDNPNYYLLERGRFYRNASGCGNTLRCSHPVVRQLIIDSLRYWAISMGVDGFRFDLATILGRDSRGEWITSEGSLLDAIADDPILSGRKLIAESWDAEGMYRVGALPARFIEWNGRFRDDVRRFIRADAGVAKDFAHRIGGSGDVFGRKGTAAASLNFITCHDGFTLRDLVSYTRKHNLRNGEENRDGSNQNFSDHCGVEGETHRPGVALLRQQQAKNQLVALFVARGTPMLLAGDELWRTQFGNNNPWCQDNSLSWVDWTETPESTGMTRFVAGLAALRRAHPALQAGAFMDPDPTEPPRPELAFHGIGLAAPDYSAMSRTLAIFFRGHDDALEEGELFVIFNCWRSSLDFQLPPGGVWRRVVDTARRSPEDIVDPAQAPEAPGPTAPVAAHSSVIFARCALRA